MTQPPAALADPADRRNDGTTAPVERRMRDVSLPTLIIAVLLSAILAATAGIALTVLGTHPGDESTEAGFARDMQVHHAQAVELATIIREQTSDPSIRTIAYDILTSQQQQMGQMFAWLRSWGLPQTSGRPPMAWMKEMDHDGTSGMDPSDTSTMSMGLLPDGRMPGMASAEEIDQLRSLRGKAAEILFLKLMVVHHRAGVTMAQAALDQSEDEQVRELATAIRAAQKVEIDAMTTLLEQRGATAP